MTSVAGMLLTGGRSRRMGVDKANLDVGGETLVARTAAALGATCDPCVEVGPGYTGWPSTVEDPPGSGPLAAVAAGAEALRTLGHDGPAVVLAVDMPYVSPGLLAGLAGHPAPASVVPVADGIPQVLCARWSSAALGAAAELVADGERSVRALLDVAPAVTVAVEDAGPFRDVDTPADLDAARAAWE